MSFQTWTDCQHANTVRAMLWHPNGLAEWSRPEWYLALAGEYFEMLTEHEPSRKAVEIADCLAYLFILAELENVPIGYYLDQYIANPTSIPHRSAIEGMSALGSAIKEGMRNRDGAAGKGWTDEQVSASIEASIISVGVGLIDLSRSLAFDIEDVFVAKFNQVSAKHGFMVTL